MEEEFPFLSTKLPEFSSEAEVTPSPEVLDCHTREPVGPETSWRFPSGRRRREPEESTAPPGSPPAFQMGMPL